MKSPKLRKYRRIARKVQQLADKYANYSDEELKSQTVKFRQQLAKGKKLEHLLVEAFAVVVEADRRVVGLKPYFVQIIGGIALFYGNVAEMKTGEGKTLAATMPLYLRGLTGSGNFLITANDYLAYRDGHDVGRVYEWLGLTVGVGAEEHEGDETVDKEAVYASDIVYTTHSALGFDYLITNLATVPEKQYVKNFNYAVVDEIDAVLLDLAQTPLVISGAPKVQSNLFEVSDWFVKSIEEDIDYEISEDQRSVWFTEDGIKKAERYFDIENILSEEWYQTYRHLVLALRANFIMKNNRDYVISNDELFLLDEANGRKLVGTKLQAGLHQAIEAKEQVKITIETKSMGVITYQNLFKKFKILSGMTGTAMTDAEEFRTTYHVDVVEIPTNVPMIRKDHGDEIFITNKAKIMTSLKAVKEAMNHGRPVLIETGSVSMSDLYSMLLLDQKIPHNLLNATTAARESWIIRDAGRAGTVTVATSMAGRGTDIKLNPAARDNNGLLVVGTERMTSERIDNQLRGRAGRQGDPGDSVFFVSLEDKIVIESAPKWVAKSRKKLHGEVDEEKMIDPQLLGKKYKSVIKKAQNSRKNQEFQTRKNTVDYDEIVSIQREKIYDTRNHIMDASMEELDEIIAKCTIQAIQVFVEEKENLDFKYIINFIFNNFNYNYDVDALNMTMELSKKNVTDLLLEIAAEQKERIKQIIPDFFQMTYYKRVIILKAIDMMWVEQSNNLQQLKTVVSSRSWGQHRPIYEYQIESKRSFLEMKDHIWVEILRNFLLSDLIPQEDGTIDIEFP
ncbi:accessory Sec system translocase SecA2 [Enterococcus alishanensis]|uniref:Protein translocase subunit SecA n=1 Tax=Enterococcus alishanensis TaxID=1303817 RepID=A0ABS6TE24_9ENTE|nr:accessory Sec system translocase SecA2 [Enterococcus alishanensis]MBV7391117.1 accessory Sec system translocase SecA2 [Enterococcus alishanensis]